MSDATLVAGQVADLVAAVQAFREAVQALEPQITVNVPAAPPAEVTVNVPESMPPVVTVNVPEAAAAAVTVNVPEAVPPAVSFEPQIVVQPPVARTYDVRITERDANGFIAAFVISPRGG